MEKTKEYPPFDLRDKIGYASGDIANNMTFSFASTFLMVFYTEVLGINPAAVGTLFLVSRFVDAITDTVMGVIVDRTPATKEGKFRPWIRRVMAPVSIAAFLMYQSSLAGASMNIKIIYMYVTYLLWGSICYTAVNIPYGSMASALTPNVEERTELSVWRTRGQSIASMLIGVITPLVIYVKDAQGNQVIRSGGTFTMVAGVFSILALFFYYITYSFTTERVKVDKIGDDDEEKVGAGQILKDLFTSRELLSASGSSVLLLMTLMLQMSMYNYVFPNYFRSSTAISMINLINPIVVIFLISPIASWMGRTIGKKEASVIGLVIGAVSYFVLYFMRTENLMVYIAISTIAYAGLSVFNILVWAMITDVIDAQEVKTGRREDGTIYAANSFARKVGQAFAGGLSGYALGMISYQSGAAQQTPEVIQGIYTISTLAPAVGFALTALFLQFVYPLSKSVTQANQTELARRRAGLN